MVVVVDFFIIGIVVVFLYLLDVKLLIWSLLVYFRTDYFFCILLLGVVIFIFCMILLFPAWSFFVDFYFLFILIGKVLLVLFLKYYYPFLSVDLPKVFLYIFLGYLYSLYHLWILYYLNPCQFLSDCTKVCYFILFWRIDLIRFEYCLSLFDPVLYCYYV